MGAELPPTELLLADQRGRWRRGDRVRVEQLVAQRPRLRDQTEVLLDLIYGEVLLRREAGERPAISEYLDRFPTLADPIRLQFEVDDAISPTRVGDDPASTESRAGSGAPAPAAPPGYEILGELGRGGMGVVYKARQVRLDRLVALKVIRAGELADPAERARFDAEAQAVARLSHPNVVQVYEVGEHQGRPFLALEYVPGGTLADALKGPPFPPRTAAALAATLARAVQHAHDAGVVHRDLKPANILLQRSEARGQKSEKATDLWPLAFDLCPKVTDFGLAKRLDADGLTRTGDFVGTPNFAAPEQAARRDIGPAADVWALGAILYQMLTGRPPFAGDSPIETLDQVRFADPVLPSRLRPKLPRDLETIALACLRKDPARRYPSAAALADDLDRFLNGETIRARPVGPVEKVAKWGRRRPAVAGLLAALAVLIATALVTSTVLWRRAAAARDAEAGARQDEAAARAGERAERERAEARAAGLLVANARYAWQSDDLEGARRMLAECPPQHRSADWADLNRACSASRLVLTTADLPVDLVAYSPDGRQLAGSSGGRVYLWDAATGRHVRTLVLPNRAVQSLALAADGRVVVAAYGTYFLEGRPWRDVAEVNVLDAETGRVLSRWERPDRPVRFLLSPGGRWLASASANSRVAELADAATGNVVHRFECKTGSMMRVAFSPDGRFLLTAGMPTDLSLWDVESGALVRRYTPPENFYGYQALAACHDGERVAVSRSNAATTGDLSILGPAGASRHLRSRLSRITEVAFDPTGRWCAAQSGGQTLIPVWAADSGEPHLILRGYPAEVRHFAFHPDGRHLAAGYRDGRVVVWDLDP